MIHSLRMKSLLIEIAVGLIHTAARGSCQLNIQQFCHFFLRGQYLKCFSVTKIRPKLQLGFSFKVVAIVGNLSKRSKKERKIYLIGKQVPCMCSSNKGQYLCVQIYCMTLRRS